MNKVFFLLLCLLTPSALWSQDPILGPPAELTLNAPWSGFVLLEFPEAGNYRLEATGLGGDPIEVIVERQGPGAVWKPETSNRTLRGNLEAVVEWSVGFGENWRVRPPGPVSQTVVLRLKKSTFAGLRESLKQGLTPGPEVSLPLHKRFELPKGTGGSGLTAAEGPGGELWVGWLTDQGSAAEVWEASTAHRLGKPILAGRTPWTALSLDSIGPVLVARGPGAAEARAWTGLEWIVEAAPISRGFSTPQGTFRYETDPMRIWRSTAAGWADLELPQNRRLDRVLLGSTEGGLYAFLGSSTGRERAFYSWGPKDGWTALPAPPAEAPPQEGLWAATNGAGSLFYLEGQGTRLDLRQFDGAEWKPALDLSALTTRGLRGAVLLPSGAASKTGTLVVATDRVVVYDLP